MLYLRNTADLSDHRIEFFEGEEHLVIPTVAAVQGVLNGQLLPVSSLEASLPAWEGVAVTMSHPKHNGMDVSANTKESVENFVVGRFFNAHVDGNKFKGEFWINLSKLNSHEDGETLLALVEAGETIEVSTAYWCHTDNQMGVHSGKKYRGVQTNLVPNHVAILLHEVGACSVLDGCGTPRTNQETELVMEEPIVTNECERKQNALQKLTSKFGEMVMSTLAGLKVNRISHGQIRDHLRNAIQSDERADSFVFIVDVFDDEVVYGREDLNGEVALFSRTYSVGSSPGYEINVDEPVEVQQVVDYTPVSNSQEEESHMNDRDALIEQLVANDGIPFDRDALTGMTDDQIAHLATNLEEPTGEPAAEPVVETEPVAEPFEADAPEGEPVTNGLSPEVAEALNDLGADGIAQVVNASKELAEQRKSDKDALVSKLVGNARVTIDEPTLRRMDTEALEGVARMAGLTSYAGAGGPVANHAASDDGNTVPAPPSIVLGEAAGIQQVD